MTLKSLYIVLPKGGSWFQKDMKIRVSFGIYSELYR
jgi:hypothetical protein